MNHVLVRSALLFALLPACGGRSAIGAYVFDDDSWKGALDRAMPQNPSATPEDKKAAEQALDDLARMMKVELTLKADNTFTADSDMGTRIDGSEGKETAFGTYKIDGDKLTLTRLEKNGKKLEEPEEEVGTMKDGLITFGQGGYTVTLRKR